MSGHDRDAIPEFERVLKVQPENLPALLSLGAARMATNDPARAIAPLKKTVQLDPSNIDARGMLANALLSTGEPQAAATQFRDLTARIPQDAKAWYGLGRSYEAIAARSFEELDKTAQGSPEWLTLVAETRMQRNQYRSAFYFFQQAIEKRPAFRAARAGLAEVYRKTEHPDWAAVEEQKLRSMPAPDCAREKFECDFAAGRLLETIKSPSLYWRARAANELALQAFLQLGRLPESIELHALKAEILTSRGQHQEAAGEWRSALKLAPGDPRVEQELATSLYLGQDYAASMPIFEKLIKQDGPSAQLRSFMGDALLRTDQPEKAVPYLESALKQDPRLLPAHASLGLAYARLGKPSEAIPHLLAAKKLDEDGSLHYQLARAYQSTGNAQSADAAMKEYTELQRQSQELNRDLENKARITAP
jgi:predicted Zn-dependent protease